MSHYVMYESTVTRQCIDVTMMADGTLNVNELTDAIQAAWDIKNSQARVPHVTLSETRVTIVDDTIRIYFDIEKRK